MESSESKEDLLPQDPWAVSTGGNDLALKGTGHDSVVVTPQEDAFSVGDPIILGEETVSVNHEELTSSNAIGNATAEALYLEHSFVQDCQKEVSRTVDSNNCNSILVLGLSLIHI